MEAINNNSGKTEQYETLFKNKNWQIDKVSNLEISITNGNDICYAYRSKNGNKLYFDRIICPKYIQDIARKLAKKHIKSIYA